MLELEGTLVFSSRHKISGFDFTTTIDWQGSDVEMYVKIRPGLDHFLAEVGRHYEVVVFTSSPKSIADAIIDRIDKNAVIQHRLYRDKCLSLNQVYYLKDMRKLNRDASNVVFVDVI